MMSKIMMMMFVLGVIVSICGLLQPKKEAHLVYYDSGSETVLIKAKNNPIIDDINSINNKTQSIQAKLQCSINNVPVKLHGELSYEKPKNFRLFIKSVIATEAEMGSNNNQFWFWSRSLRPRALYYANHTDIEKAKLKAGLSPLFIMDALCINEIKIDDKTELREDGDKIRIIKNLGSLKKIIVVDKKNKKIVGNYLLRNNDVIASGEVLQFRNNVPSCIKIIWRDGRDTVVMHWHLTQCNINRKLMATNFELPKYSHRVDLTKD